jgi:hypothetical protein
VGEEVTGATQKASSSGDYLRLRAQGAPLVTEVPMPFSMLADNSVDLHAQLVRSQLESNERIGKFILVWEMLAQCCPLCLLGQAVPR